MLCQTLLIPQRTQSYSEQEAFLCLLQNNIKNKEGNGTSPNASFPSTAQDEATILTSARPRVAPQGGKKHVRIIHRLITYLTQGS